jgi:RNA polymerase sigma-70 factor (ECF subfamily)
LFDQGYIIALQQQDREVEAHLVSFFAKPLLCKLHARLRSPQLIEDARQETYLRVFAYFRSGKELKDPASLPAFVLSVCNNVCYELLRADTRHPQLAVNSVDPADRSMDPEEAMVTAERKEIVTKILAELPTKDRSLLRRVFLDEADKDQVCREFGVGRDYLRVLIHRAKQRLKVALAGSGGELRGRSAAPLG